MHQVIGKQNSNVIFLTNNHTTSITNKERIQYLSPAYKDTWVIIKTTATVHFVTKVLVHIDHNGITLYSISLKQYDTAFRMPREDQLLFFNNVYKTISLLSLKTYKINQIRYEDRLAGWKELCQIETFYEKGFIAFVQGEIDQIDGRNTILNVSYHIFASFLVRKEPIAEYTWDMKTGEPWYEMTVSKVDEYSKIGWWTHKYSDQPLQFTCISLVGQNEVKIEAIKTVNTISSRFTLSPSFTKVLSIWELKPHRFLVYTKKKSNLKNGRSIIKQMINKKWTGICQVDTSEGSHMGRIDAFKVRIRQAFIDISNIFIKGFPCGGITVFISQQTINNPLYKNTVQKYFYFLHQTKQILSVGQVCSKKTREFKAADWNPKMVVCINEKQYQQQELKKQISLQRIVIEVLSDVYMQLLLHLNEDFDDDLLQEAIQLLKQEEQNVQQSQ